MWGLVREGQVTERCLERYAGLRAANQERLHAAALAKLKGTRTRTAPPLP